MYDAVDALVFKALVRLDHVEPFVDVSRKVNNLSF